MLLLPAESEVEDDISILITSLGSHSDEIDIGGLMFKVRSGKLVVKLRITGWCEVVNMVIMSYREEKTTGEIQKKDISMDRSIYELEIKQIESVI